MRRPNAEIHKVTGLVDLIRFFEAGGCTDAPTLVERYGLCDEHSGFHLGHWTSHGQRARHFWGTEIYNRINRYYRVHRPHHDKSQ